MRFVAAVVLLVSMGCRAAESMDPAPDGQDPVSGVQGQATDDHAWIGDIQPLGSLPSYFQPVIETLGDHSDAALWMVACPSFTPPTSVALSAPDRSAPSGNTWLLEAAYATKLIRGSGSVTAVPEVRRFSAELRDADAERIVRGWTMVVRRARNESPECPEFEDGTIYREGVRRFDGVEYRFVGGEYSGRAHSPGPGLASDLIALGEKLYWVAASPPEYREELISDCVKVADALGAKAEAARW